MRTISRAAILAALSWSGSAWAYGGGGGSDACAEPKFFEPHPGGPVAELSEFKFIASDNTDTDTLTVDIGGQRIAPAVEKRRSGDYAVTVVLPRAITQAGTVRVAVNAKSREGCWGFTPYSVEVRP